MELLLSTVGVLGGRARASAADDGLHSCVRDGLFCLSLLPSTAAPALALITDAVGAPMDAPLLAVQ